MRASVSHRSRPVLAILLVAGALAFLWPTAPARALMIGPPILELELNPGESATRAIHVLNDGHAPVRLSVTFADFTNKAGDETTGTPILYPPDQDQSGRGLAPWMRVVSTPSMLAPGAEGNVFFEVDVPANGEPGGKFGAVVIQEQSTPGQGAIGVTDSVAALVLVRVRGDVKEDLSLTDFRPDRTLASSLPIDFTLRTENRGTVHLRPSGTITITDLFGRTAAVLPVNPEAKDILPDSARRYDASWAKAASRSRNELAREWGNFALGPYTARLDLHYGEGNHAAAVTAHFWVVPWLVLLVGIGGGAAGIGLLLLWGRWYARQVIRRHEAGKRPPPP